MKRPLRTRRIDTWSYSKIGIVIGLCLGFSAPAGCMALRMLLLEGGMNWDWIRAEWQGNSFFYHYILFSTPIVFSVFGYALGSLRDRVFYQNTSLERLNSTLKNQSLTDDVTGQYNHRHLLHEIEKSLERAVRNKRDLSALMVDLDDFKRVNDRFGHLAGDYVLKEVAGIMHRSIRKIDTLGRYGGDEFMVILPEVAPEGAQRIAQRIQKNISRHPFSIGKKKLPITVSIGIASVPDLKQADKLSFIDRVDRAMLQAKKTGKDKIILGDKGSNQDAG